jgi:two-component system response regulator VicR
MDRTRQPRRWRLLGRALAADLVLRCIYRCGRSLALSQQQFQLLQLLSDADGGVLTYPDLAHAIWGIGGRGSVALLRKLVRDLWREIEPDPKQPMYILCRSRTGYRSDRSRYRW